MALNKEIRGELSQVLRQWDEEHGRHARYSSGNTQNDDGRSMLFLTNQNRRDLEDYLNARNAAKDGTTFSEMVLQRIDEMGKKDSEVYNKAKISKSVFSNLRNDRNYQPSRETALGLTIALHMTIPKSEQLLEKAGFALSDDRRFDQIVKFCIEHGIDEVTDVNDLLYERGEQTIYNKGDKEKEKDKDKKK